MKRRNVALFVVIGTLVGCLPEYYSTGRRDDSSGPVEATAVEPAPPVAVLIPLGAPPEFGATVRQADPPPPLSGGTVAVAADGFTVVAADPDRDRVYVLDHRDASTLKTVALHPHDEPGRVVVDGANRAHIALRSAGAVVTVDVATATVVSRIDVCSAPRGIAYDPATDVVHVACAGGELVTLEAASGAEVRRRMIASDLRDVVVVPGALMLSTFRDARVLRLEDGSNAAVERPAEQSPGFGRPRVAWRMIAAPPGRSGMVDVVIARQKAPDTDDPAVVVPPAPAQYYDSTPPAESTGCEANGPGPVLADGVLATHVPSAVLPVDVTVSRRWAVLVAAGNAHTWSMPQLVFIDRANSPARFSCTTGYRQVRIEGAQITSVAFVESGSSLVALSREPAALIVVDASSGRELQRISLASESREDTGHAIFHSNSGAGVACASCHPDGRDDGHAWRSQKLGARRTPSLLGTLSNTAPYHWNGEAKDIPALVRLTFESRMRGPWLPQDRVDAMGGWLQALRQMPAAKASDAAAASRGKALFEGAALCATCHGGAMRTNNATVDVATGGLFQVPSLVGVAWRAPHLHDGSVPSVRALLQRSHGGVTLQAQQVVDLSSYVETF